MSRLIANLTQAAVVNPGDFIVVNQGVPAITRRATLAQLLGATLTSSGQVGAAPGVHGPLPISQLPLAATVFVNDTVMLDQGTPGITRLATVAQILNVSSAGTTANSELKISPVDKQVSGLPLATNTSLTDMTVMNQTNTRTGVTKTYKIAVGQILPTVADFSGTPLTGLTPLSVAFTDLSTPRALVTAWSWSFGDGQTSTLQNPTNVYALAGAYTVALTATINGVPTTKTKIAYVNPTEIVTPLFLNHFNNLRGAGPNVASALGPDMAPHNTAGLTTSKSVFGGSAGTALNDNTSSFSISSFTPVIPIVNVSWRIEGWVWSADPSLSLFDFEGGGTGFAGGLSLNNNNPGFDFDFHLVNSHSSTSGAVGSGANQPPLNQWNHYFIQWNDATGEIVLGCNGKAYSASFLGAGGYPGAFCNQIQILGSSNFTNYCDEFRLVTINTPAGFYPNTTYTVPVAPFPPFTP